MRSAVLARPLAGATALALATLALGPAVAHMHRDGAAGTPPPTHLRLPAHVLLRGTLLTLHRNQRTGDLLLATGDLIPLRFASQAQERGLRVGDGLDVAAAEQGHARLWVHALSDEGAGSRWTGSQWTGSYWTGKHWAGKHWAGSRWTGKHWAGSRWTGKHWAGQTWAGSRWTGKHWAGKHWAMHGVVTRVLGHGAAEVVGVNGAATVVRTTGATVSGSNASGTTGTTGTTATLAVPVADAATRPVLAPGEGIDMALTVNRTGTVTVVGMQVVTARVARVDLEGTVTRVNRTAGTLTLPMRRGRKPSWSSARR